MVTSRIISVGLAFAVNSSFHGVTSVSKPCDLGYAAGYCIVKPRGDLPELGLCGADGGARRQPRVDVGHAMTAFVLHRRAHVVVVRSVIDVEVLLSRRRVVRARLEHTDDDGFLHRQVERLPDDCRVRSEHALPVAVREHDHRLRGLAPVARQQQPPEMRPDAEELEEVRRHQPAGRPVRVATSENVERPVAKLDELVDGRRLRPVVGDFREREARVLDARRDLRLAQVDDPVGFGVGKRPQQHAVDDAEDRCIGPDAEAERQDEREREPGHARQRAQRKTDVVDHDGSSRQSTPDRRGIVLSVVERLGE